MWQLKDLFTVGWDTRMEWPRTVACFKNGVPISYAGSVCGCRVAWLYRLIYRVCVICWHMAGCFYPTV